MHACTYTHIHTHARTHTHSHTLTRTHIYTHAYTHTHTCIHTYTHIHTSAHTHIAVCRLVCMMQGVEEKAVVVAERVGAEGREGGFVGEEGAGEVRVHQYSLSLCQ